MQKRNLSLSGPPAIKENRLIVANKLRVFDEKHLTTGVDRLLGTVVIGDVDIPKEKKSGRVFKIIVLCVGCVLDNDGFGTERDAWISASAAVGGAACGSCAGRR